MKIKFLGAVGSVTGSCSFLEYPRTNIRFLVDCGMTQGQSNAANLNSAPWPFTASRLAFLLLTHAHLDHCGLLARLVREGFHGPVYCTRFTAELTRLNLISAARLSGALFTVSDVQKINFFHVDAGSEFEFGKYMPLATDLEMAFHPTAHIGGACSVGVKWKATDDTWREIVFSGDLGSNVPSCAPQPLLAARQPLRSNPDYLLVESTYGSRVRADKYSNSLTRLSEIKRVLQDCVDRFHAAGGKAGSTLVIPCFSIHRCQELLADLHAVLDIGMRNQLVLMRPTFAEPEHLERALSQGIKASRITNRYRGMLSTLDASAKARFHKLFGLTTDNDTNGKSSDVFVPVDQREETLVEARNLLQHAQNYKSIVQVQVMVDSPSSQRVCQVYRRELQRRTENQPSRLLYRNDALKAHFGVASEAEVDEILAHIFIGQPVERGMAVEQQFLTYSLLFCHPEQSSELLKPKALNIILSSSGMGDNGPVVPHLQRHLQDANATILLTGYAASNTVVGQLRTFANTGATGPDGRLSVDGQEIPDLEICAQIEDLSSYYSGHADQEGLLDFVFQAHSSVKTTTQPATIFVNHGGDEVRAALSAAISERTAEGRPGDRAIRAVELPTRDHGAFDLDACTWLPPEPAKQEENAQELMLRLLMEQRRTNDLLTELIDLQRQRPFRVPGAKS